MRVRVRRGLKWGCLSLGAVLLVASVVGQWWKIGRWWAVQVGSNGVLAHVEVNTRQVGMTFIVPRTGASEKSSGESPARSSRSLLTDWVFERDRSPLLLLPDRASLPWWYHIRVPVSNLAVLTLVPGVILWRLDRRRAAHECPKCRYDRRGLAEGAGCPECGAPAPPEPERAT